MLAAFSLGFMISWYETNIGLLHMKKLGCNFPFSFSRKVQPIQILSFKHDCVEVLDLTRLAMISLNFSSAHLYIVIIDVDD